MFNNKTILVNKYNIVINTNYTDSMPIAKRNHDGIMPIKICSQEKQTINLDDKVIIWENRFGESRALSLKHARVKAVKYIYKYNFIAFLLNINTSDVNNGKILKFPINKAFLRSKNITEGVECLKNYWQQLLNENIKLRDLESPISL